MGKKRRLDQATKTDIINVLYMNSSKDQAGFIDYFNDEREKIARRNDFGERAGSGEDKAFKTGNRDIKAWLTGAWAPGTKNLDASMAMSIFKRAAYKRKARSAFTILLKALDERGFDIEKYRDLEVPVGEDIDDFYNSLYDEIVEIIIGCAFMENANENTNETAGSVELVTVKELKARGFTPLSIAQQLVKNDKAIYGLAEGSPNEGNAQQWSRFISKWPECWRFLLHANKIVGNWSFTALNDNQNQRITAIEGQLLEQDLDLDNVSNVFVPGVHSLYLLNLSTNEGYNESRYQVVLLNSLFDQLVQFAKSGIYFKEIIVNVCAPEGESFFQTLGFKHIANNQVKGKIYHLDMIPFPKGISSPELQQLYCNLEYAHGNTL